MFLNLVAILTTSLTNLLLYIFLIYKICFTLDFGAKLSCLEYRVKLHEYL